jgi:hypothetical protein
MYKPLKPIAQLVYHLGTIHPYVYNPPNLLSLLCGIYFVLQGTFVKFDGQAVFLKNAVGKAHKVFSNNKNPNQSLWGLEPGWLGCTSIFLTK